MALLCGLGVAGSSRSHPVGSRGPLAPLAKRVVRARRHIRHPSSARKKPISLASCAHVARVRAQSSDSAALGGTLASGCGGGIQELVAWIGSVDLVLGTLDK